MVTASPWFFRADHELESPPTSFFLSIAWIKHQTLFPSSEIFVLVRSTDEGWSGSLKRVLKQRGSNVANHKQLFLFNCRLPVCRIPSPPWINGSILYLAERRAEVVGSGHHVSPAFLPLGRGVLPVITQSY